MARLYDLAIVGGGAAGLFAAVTAAQKGLSVVLLEKGPRVGKKLLATGNGTCNISNLHAAPAHYHGVGAEAFVRSALACLSPEQTMDAFSAIGLECVARPDGRVYPLCEQAAAVLDCLRLTAAGAGVHTLCDAQVTAVRRKEKGFELVFGKESVSARRVLMAGGGAASPSLGGCKEGYCLLISIGHTRTKMFPSIVQVRTDTQYLRAVKGIRVDARVAFCLNGRELAAETGEVLFTEYGLSGPAVMYISRVVGEWECGMRGTMTAVLDLLPAYTAQQVRAMLSVRRTLTGRNMEDYFTGLLNKRVGQTLVRACGLALTAPVSALSNADIDRLVDAVKAFTVTVERTQGYAAAQVMAGGISLDEFDAQTMQSRVVRGVYAAGEVLDVDGDCGGYNLQWAWSSAALAVRSIAEELL